MPRRMLRLRESRDSVRERGIGHTSYCLECCHRTVRLADLGPRDATADSISLSLVSSKEMKCREIGYSYRQIACKRIPKSSEALEELIDG